MRRARVVRSGVACVVLLLGLLAGVVAVAATGGSKERRPAVVAYGAEAFKFVTEVEDDGKDGAAGWQATNASLHLSVPDKTDDYGCTIPGKTWNCDFRVGMPLRTRKHNKISPRRAAGFAASVSTRAERNITIDGDKPGITCTNFKNEMQRLFDQDKEFDGLGGRISPPK